MMRAKISRILGRLLLLVGGTAIVSGLLLAALPVLSQLEGHAIIDAVVLAVVFSCGLGGAAARLLWIPWNRSRWPGLAPNLARAQLAHSILRIATVVVLVVWVLAIRVTPRTASISGFDTVRSATALLLLFMGAWLASIAAWGLPRDH